MADNIFKRLRLECTEETVMRGEGKKTAVKRPFSGTRLAKELHISQSTLDKVENGFPPSFSTAKAYHDYFNVPYSTLYGEIDTMDIQNFSINKELGLSDNCISTIKSLSPIALSMLNALLSQSVNTELFLYNLADITYSLTEQLAENGNDKNSNEYLKLKQQAENIFMDYMKTITFKDLKKILLQLEQQYNLINSIETFDNPTA